MKSQYIYIDTSVTCFFKNGKCKMKMKILNLHQIDIKRIVTNDGYLLISRNISLYHVIHQMPIKLDPNKLDQRSNVEKKNAKYQQNCRM